MIDLDGTAGQHTFTQLVAAALPIEPTYSVRTPNGEHRYFTVNQQTPVRSSVGRLGRGVDTRGAGGYVLGAGSVRRRAGRPRYYRTISTPGTAPVPVPPWLLEALRPAAPPHSASADGPRACNLDGSGPPALEAEAARVLSARVGTRNSTLFSAAVRMGRLVAAGLLDERAVSDRLLQAAQTHIGVDNFTAHEAERAIANGLRYGQQRSRRS